MTSAAEQVPVELPPTDDLEEIERRLAMPLGHAMTTQRAVRRVLPDPVDERIVRRLIELAVQAPSGSNGQNWEFVVVTDREIKAKLAAQYRRSWGFYGWLGKRFRGGDEQTARILRSVDWQLDNFVDIPVLVVGCLAAGTKVPFFPNPPMVTSSHYGSIYPAVQNLLLGARAVGLGASLVTLPLWSQTVARRILKLPLTVEACCIVPMGWAKGRYGPKARKPIDELVHFDTYGTR